MRAGAYRHIASADLRLRTAAGARSGRRWLGLEIPFGVGRVVMIWYLRSHATVRLGFRRLTPRWELFADILKVGVP